MGGFAELHLGSLGLIVREKGDDVSVRVPWVLVGVKTSVMKTAQRNYSSGWGYQKNRLRRDDVHLWELSPEWEHH